MNNAPSKQAVQMQLMTVEKIMELNNVCDQFVYKINSIMRDYQTTQGAPNGPAASANQQVQQANQGIANGYNGNTFPMLPFPQINGQQVMPSKQTKPVQIKQEHQQNLYENIPLPQPMLLQSSDVPKPKKHSLKKRPKQKMPPGRRWTSYLTFCTYMRAQSKKENPQMSNNDLMKELGQKWGGMSNEQKEVWKKESAKLNQQDIQQSQAQDQQLQTLMKGNPDDLVFSEQIEENCSNPEDEQYNLQQSCSLPSKNLTSESNGLQQEEQQVASESQNQ